MYANFEHYKTFYYVAKYKNFTKAANALLTSQPAVTCCIQNLESALGCKLFIRSNKGVKLTEEGELLYRYVAPACETIAEGEQALREELGTKNKAICIGTTQMAMTFFLLPRLNEFKKEYPDANLKIKSSTTPDTLEQLQNGKVDIAIVTTPFTLNEGFKAIKVKEFQSVFIAGTKYQDLKGRQVRLEELASYPLVTSSHTTTSYQFLQDLFIKVGASVKPEMEASTMDLIVPMVESNLGIGFVSMSFAKAAIEKGNVFAIDLKEEIPTRNICLVTDTRRPLSAEVSCLCQVLEELERENRR